ncbi:hypothetical protein PENTCL1PPCAC_8212, partial [Pristionchus entomophagus]
ISSSTYRLSYGRADVYPGSEACEAAAALNRNYVVWTVDALIALETILGLVICILISIRVYKHEIFHINQRILLVLIGVMLSVRSIFSLYKSGSQLYRLLSLKSFNTVYVSVGHVPNAFVHPPPLTVNSTFVVFCTSVAYPKIRWHTVAEPLQIDILYKFRQFPVIGASMLIFTPSARIVYPNMICFALLHAIGSTCTILCAYLQTDGARVTLAVVIKECGTLAFNAHLIAHPLILIWREPSLWR